MSDYIANGYAGVFQPEEIKLLVAAYEDAWTTVRASGTFLDGKTDTVREILAKHIVQEAMARERDQHLLRDAGLAFLAKAQIL